MPQHKHNKHTVPIGELAAGAQVIGQRLNSGEPRPSHPAAAKQPAPKPAAAGGGEIWGGGKGGGGEV